MTLKEAARSYVEYGWSVIPLHTMRGGVCSCGRVCGSPGKRGEAVRSTTLFGRFEWGDAICQLRLDGHDGFSNDFVARGVRRDDDLRGGPLGAVRLGSKVRDRRTD